MIDLLRVLEDSSYFIKVIVLLLITLCFYIVFQLFKTIRCYIRKKVIIKKYYISQNQLK